MFDYWFLCEKGEYEISLFEMLLVELEFFISLNYFFVGYCVVVVSIWGVFFFNFIFKSNK